MDFPYFRRETDKDKQGFITEFICYLIIIFSSLFIIRPLFDEGIPLLLDNPKHLSETIYLAKYLIPETHWINGWSMSDFAGFPILLYHYILGKTLAALISIVCGINIVSSYKIMMAVSLIFPSCTLFFLFSKFFGKLPSLIAVYFFLLQTSHIIKISQGMWNNYFALGFFPLFIYSLLRFSTTNSLRFISMASLIFSLTFISHQYVAIAESLFAATFLIVSFFSKKENSFKLLTNLSAVAFLSLALSLFYLYPFIEVGNWLSENKMFGGGEIHPLKSLYHYIKVLLNIPENISVGTQIFKGNIKLFFNNLFELPFIKTAMIILDITAITGLILTFSRMTKRNGVKTAFAGFTFLLLIISSDIWRAFDILNNLPFARGIENNRLILFPQFGFLFFSASGLEYFLKTAKKKKILICFFLVIAISGGLVTLSSHLEKNNFFITSKSLNTFPEIFAFWKWAEMNINSKEERILIQRTKGNTEDVILNESHILSLTWLYSGVNHIGAWNSGFPYTTEKIVTTEGGRMLGMNVNGLYEDKLIKRMNVFNTGYIAAISADFKLQLQKSVFFDESADFGIIKVFKLSTFKPSWIDFLDGAGKVSSTFINPQKIKADIIAEKENNLIRIKIQNHPYWKAVVDGNITPINTDKYGLMTIHINGKGIHELNLLYSSIRLFPIAISVTALFTLILLYGLSLKKGKDLK